MGGGTAGGRVDEARGRPIWGRGGVEARILVDELFIDAVEDDGELEAAYG